MTEPRAQTLRLQSAANRIVRGLLRVPLLNRLVGARLIVIDVVGRTSGRHMRVPVAYTRDNDDLLVGTPFGWGRNLSSGQQVKVLLKGRWRATDVTVITDEAGVIDAYGTMARDNSQFARFNKITLDDNGNPDPADLHLAWAAGARAFRLRPV
jgi:hypothetical protein